MREDQLHAWLDGQQSQEERDEVEAWLRTHPEDAELVRRWAADAAALRAELEPILNEPVPTRLEQIVWNHAPMSLSGRWSRLAAALAVFAFGGLLGAGLVWEFRPPQMLVEAPAQSNWVQRATVAHRVYVPESRHPVEVNVADKSAADHNAQELHLARWLTNRLAFPVKLFDLSTQGFELVGGRLLPDTSGPSAQLMYQHANGERVTVYLRKPESVNPEPTPAQFEYERRGDLGMFYWVEGRAGYALVGAMPKERLLAIAQQVHRQCIGVAK